MQRREFITKTSLGITAVSLPAIIRGAARPDPVLGHHSHRYRQVIGWGIPDGGTYPVKDCHEMIEDSNGRLILLTNEVRNNVLIYDRSGKLLQTWGHEFPGGHGLTLSRENDEEFLFLTDYELHKVFKTTLDGRILMTIGVPLESGVYTNADQFKPTEVAVAPNGDFYIADGYGSQYILHYDHSGKLQGYFGGPGDEDEKFRNAHGICLDNRDPQRPSLLVTSRAKHTLKRFSLTGEYMEKYPMPGAMIHRPVIKGENVYLSVLMSDSRAESGFVLILDKNNKAISCPGGSMPEYEGGVPRKMYQTVKLFKHPHDVCVDSDENIYIPQWNSGNTYPIKLERI